MKTMLQNPSNRLLQAIGLTADDIRYQKTCHSDTCCCASHDSGYDYVEVDNALLEGVEIHHYNGSVHSHGSDVLREEYIEAHTAKGLPENAPQWAYTLESRGCRNGIIYTGSGVDVSQDDGFTVVRLMDSFKYGYCEVNLFATKDCVGNHTKQYRKIRFEKLRDQRVAEFVENGLSRDEAQRLFNIGKEQWTREQEPRLIANATLLREVAPYHLANIALAGSNRDISAAAHVGGILDLVSGLSHPRATAFAAKALWVFHGKKNPIDAIQDGYPSGKPLDNSLERAFACS